MHLWYLCLIYLSFKVFWQAPSLEAAFRQKICKWQATSSFRLCPVSMKEMKELSFGQVCACQSEVFTEPHSMAVIFYQEEKVIALLNNTKKSFKSDALTTWVTCLAHRKGPSPGGTNCTPMGCLNVEACWVFEFRNSCQTLIIASSDYIVKLFTDPLPIMSLKCQSLSDIASVE